MSLLSRLLKRTPADNPEAQLDNCLSVDIEVHPSDSQIYALAGVRADTEDAVTFNNNTGPLDDALARLDGLAEDASIVLGHNLIRFDLPRLRAVKPQMRLFDLPAVDTLMLNPLAFPRNPYHHLVKHYQDGRLHGGQANDPKRDAELALELFGDQRRAFLGHPDPALMAAWHWLTTANGEEGFDLVFSAVRGSSRPDERDAMAALSGQLEGVGCINSAEDILNSAGSHGWPLAYALAWLSVAEGNSVMPPWVRHQFSGDRDPRASASRHTMPCAGVPLVQ